MTDRLLVVVPCLNEAAHLPELLPRLLSELAGLDARLVVADGGSTDASRAIVQALARDAPQLVLLDNPAKLQSAGVNRAVGRYGADRDWLVRIDAHADYPDHFVGRLVETAVARGADAVVVPMLTKGVGCFQQAVAAAQNSVIGTGGSPHRTGGGGWVDHGHHALMRLDAFRAVGGYREDFSHNEDAELDHRLTGRGARLWLAGDLRIGYYPRATPGALVRQYYAYGRGRARTVALHRLRLKPRQALPLLVAPATAAAAVGAVLAPVHPAALLLAAPATAWLAACLGGGVLVAWRARTRCSWGAGVAAALMHLAWSTGYWRQILAGRGLAAGTASS